jgi:exodeoxyribonuclease-3
MPLIISWNVNSVAARLELLKKLIEEHNPDVILLQELKCIDEKFPREAIEHYGYNIECFGQKSYNGVAILSKSPIEDCTRGFVEDESSEARYIEGVTLAGGKVVRVASVYVPNGQEVGSEKFKFKLRFFASLKEHMQQRLSYDENFIVGGDYNVAPENIDVYNPMSLEGTVGFHIDERKAFRNILALGMYDTFRALNPAKSQFSWWDYRSNGWKFNRGMRIDQILASPQALDITKSAGIIDQFRDYPKTSDHAPIFIELE